MPTRTRTAKDGHRSRAGRGLRAHGAALAPRRGSRRGSGRRRPSLEELLVSSWAGLCTDGVAECPVCGERSLAVGGCRDCGSELS